MAEFGIPDEPGFRGTPVLGPLAASVAGFTQGLERGLQSREQKKAALAKQQAQEKAARIKAGAVLGRSLTDDFGDLTKPTSVRVLDLSRQEAVLKKTLASPLSNLTDEQKQKMQFDINLLSDEQSSLRTSLASFRRLEIVVGALNPQQQTIFKQNLLSITENRDFFDFDEFTNFKKQLDSKFEPKVAQALGEALEAERERGTITIRSDILGPGAAVLDPSDEPFLQSLFE